MYQSNLDEKPALTFDLDELITMTQLKDDNQRFGLFNDYQLESAYQSIYSPKHHRFVGFESLLRANHKDSNTSPLTVFNSVQTEQDIVKLDRLCRLLHILNFSNAEADPLQNQWIFVNIHPSVVLNGKKFGSFFPDFLEKYNIPPHRIVVEITENNVVDEKLLSDTIDVYKNIGCLVAIDDFGTGYSNFHRIWSLSPDIIKLDKSIISQAMSNEKLRRALPNLIGMIHESGSLALIEGIETQEEAFYAVDCEADLLQGYFIEKPKPADQINVDPPQHLKNLIHDQSRASIQNSLKCNKKLGHIKSLFQLSINSISRGKPLDEASQILISTPHVNKCYLIDHAGNQIGDNIFDEKKHNIQYEPMNDAENANWSLRPYFKRAVSHFNELQKSRPYLSISDGKIVITLSQSFSFNGELLVFCCDIAWDSDICH
jgi:EAL domain-containing protein (putative c-di-GMP-specific phosphodiesterase class I)